MNVGFLLADLAFEGCFEPDDTKHGFNWTSALEVGGPSVVESREWTILVRYFRATLREHVSRLSACA